MWQKDITEENFSHHGSQEGKRERIIQEKRCNLPGHVTSDPLLTRPNLPIASELYFSMIQLL